MKSLNYFEFWKLESYMVSMILFPRQSTIGIVNLHKLLPFWVSSIIQYLLELCTYLDTQTGSQNDFRFRDTHCKWKESRIAFWHRNTIRYKFLDKIRRFSGENKLKARGDWRIYPCSSLRPQNDWGRDYSLRTKICYSLRNSHRKTTWPCNFDMGRPREVGGRVDFLTRRNLQREAPWPRFLGLGSNH